MTTCSQIWGLSYRIGIFSALGKYIEKSGETHVLQETGVIRKFSFRSFFIGKAYNRCKRIHQLFAAALELLQQVKCQSVMNSSHAMKQKMLEMDMIALLPKKCKTCLMIIKNIRRDKDRKIWQNCSVLDWLHRVDVSLRRIYKRHSNWRFRFIYLLSSKIGRFEFDFCTQPSELCTLFGEIW